MKRLTLIRHAKAEPSLPNQTDFERTLTPRGRKDAKEMARRLKERKLHVDFILSSPAPRALATAEIFAHALKLPANHLATDERLYNAGVKDLMTVLHEQGKHAHIAIAAHNPGIADFADKLSAERRIDSMPTCAVVTMELPIDAWSELIWDLGIDVDFDYPGRVH